MQETISYDKYLAPLGIASLNEMQQAAIAAASDKDHIILLSATGSGKTLAFLLPLLDELYSKPKQTGAMVVVPSRELALQIESVFRSMGTGLKVTCCYGGHKREIEEQSLVEAPALIVGTPGRIADHLRRGNIKADTIHTLVLDEFDKSLELGFRDEIEEIISGLPSVKKKMLTSATEAVEFPSFLGLEDPLNLNFLPEEGTATEALAVHIVHAHDKDKIDTLFGLIYFLGARPTIIFCNHRESVERTSSLLSDKGIINTFYHGAMEQKEREVALAKFRNGSINFLVTTDLASRGLDIPHIRYIIHYHLPATEDVFTHRNGRTARMDASGTAIVMLGPDEKKPPFLSDLTAFTYEPSTELPEKPKWTTFFVGAGKKDKVNKVDIVGFLSNKAELKKEDIGLIEVKDFFSFVAVRKSKASHTLVKIKDQKIKNRKVKIDIAK